MRGSGRFLPRTTEIVFVEWDPNFYAVLKNGVVIFASFTEERTESNYKSDLAEKLERKLERYFSGKKEDFLEFEVSYPTAFSKRVLEEVRKIGFGETRSYGEIAGIVKTSPRAVGVALKMNKVPVIVPCHRVVAKNGLGGYSLGVDLKLKLLELEGAACVYRKGKGNL